MNIHKSAEDYLEAILVLQNQNGYVRSVDIAEKLGVTKPSVSVAMKGLRTDGYIEMLPTGQISLEPKGREIAERIYERHKFLRGWLLELGLSPETAEEDACRIEHDVSPETFAAIKEYVAATLEVYTAGR